MTGDDVLDAQEIDHGTAWDLWRNFLALALMAVGFFALAFIQLLRIKKTK